MKICVPPWPSPRKRTSNSDMQTNSEPALRHPNPSLPVGARRLLDAATKLLDWGVAVVNTNTSAIRIQKSSPSASLDSAGRRLVASNFLGWTVRCQGRGRPLEPCELEAYWGNSLVGIRCGRPEFVDSTHRSARTHSTTQPRTTETMQNQPRTHRYSRRPGASTDGSGAGWRRFPGFHGRCLQDYCLDRPPSRRPWAS